MSTGLATRAEPETLPEVTEKALIGGDLSSLNVNERLGYYHARCRAANLNPLCRPFGFVKMKGGGTVLYAFKECAEQLNAMHGISHVLSGVIHDEKGGVIEVMVQATMANGGATVDVGAVSVLGLKGEDLANARMKAFTKAKRRSTLSLCGLGDMMDESELDTVATVKCTDNGTPIPVDNRSGHGSGKYANEVDVGAYRTAVEGYLAKRNGEWLDTNTDKDTGDIPSGIKDLCNIWQADGHLAKWCESVGYLVPGSTPEGGIKARQIGTLTAIPWFRSTAEQNAIKRELKRYIDDIERQQLERIELAKSGDGPDDGEVMDGDAEPVADDEWEEGRE